MTEDEQHARLDELGDQLARIVERIDELLEAIGITTPDRPDAVARPTPGSTGRVER